MDRFFARPLLAVIAAALWLVAAVPAQAAVTITFWSHEFGHSFPHAFVTLRGVPDAGGAPVDTAYGFTARAVTPAMLVGDVDGLIDIPTGAYIESSTAQFSLRLTDARYAQELALAKAWDAPSGTRYNLNGRNCVHFVKEAARIAGLSGLDRPRLMKKPRSYLLAIDAANQAMVTTVAMKGGAYLASLLPLAPTPVTPIPVPGVPPAPIPAPAPDLHVAPPSRIDQPAGRISTTSRVEANAG